MILRETARFAKIRKKVRDRAELEALRAAIERVLQDPQAGKKLKGELGHLRSFPFSARGQARRLVYHWERETITLFSFGPRQRIYK